MLKRQVALYADHGVSQFDVQRDEMHGRKDERELLLLLDSLQMLARSGGAIGALRIRPVISVAASVA